MLRGTFLANDRCTNGHQAAPDKNERLWDPEYACPRVRDEDYLVSRTSYGKPVDVWGTSLAQGHEFVFDLGTASTERERWRRYSPATDHERRTEANSLARGSLVRWFRTPESPHARDSFIGTAEASVQFRRLMMRYGLGGRDPMKLEDIAEDEGVSRIAVMKSLATAVESLSALSTDVEHAGLRAVAIATAELAEQAKFVDSNTLEHVTLSAHYIRSEETMKPNSIEELAEALGGPEREALLSGGSNWSTDPDEWSSEDVATARQKFGTVIRPDPHGTSWSSDANARPSLMDAYTDGWIARFEEAKDTSCHFRNRKLRKKWHQGYREAAQELAARREANFSTS